MNTTDFLANELNQTRSRLYDIEGIEVEVSLHGKPVEINEYGYLGKIEKTGSGTLRVNVLPGYSYVGYDRQENNGEAWPLHNDGINGMTAYQKTVVLSKDPKGIVYPDQKAAIWLLHTDETGKIKVFLIALVSQNGHFFVTYSLLYKEQAYRNEKDQIVSPAMAEKWWPIAQEAAYLLGEKKNLVLPPLSEYKPAAVRKEVFADGQGRVLWFNVRLGIGVVETNQGQARVHWTEAPFGNDGLQYFLEDEMVRFERIEPRVGHKPRPALEIKGVQLLEG